MPHTTIVTPTYNRAHTLRRLFESLKKQDSYDFEWLIIDDGSTDNTRNAVDNFKDEANFTIRYYYQENEGKHTALNYSYKLIDSEYLIIVDSDDELVENAITLTKQAWDSIPKKEYDRFWLVSGRCIDSQTNKVVSAPYPENINRLRGRKQHKILTKIKGEKACSRKVSVLKQYPFPEFSDAKFVLESIVWNKIDQDYDQYCINDILRIYHTDSKDSLGKGKVHSTTINKSKYYAHLFYINECFEQIFYNQRVIISLINISKSAILSGVAMHTVLKNINKWYKKAIVLMGYPISKIRVISERKKSA